MQERQECHILSSYFAPRGHNRMYALGMQLAQLYLSPFDKLIGVIGEAGSGKSALIRGMFPGVELTNDDDGVYVRPLPLLDTDSGRGFFHSLGNRARIRKIYAVRFNYGKLKQNGNGTSKKRGIKNRFHF